MTPNSFARRSRGRCTSWRPSGRATDLAKLRAELVRRRLEQLDFRSDNLGQALTAMAQRVERTIRRLAA
jgi:hypothetical protein